VGFTDEFYGQILSFEPPFGGRDKVIRVRSIDETIDHVWLTSAKKVSLLEVIAAAAAYDPAQRELVRKGCLTLAMRLASS
jgi:hypothetical protein